MGLIMKSLWFSLKVAVLVGLIAAIPLTIIIYPKRYKVIRKLKSMFVYHMGPGLGGSGVCNNCSELFPDKVKAHQQAYFTEGISHQPDDVGILSLFNKGKLVQIGTNEFFTVRPLQYSKPYILPKGKAFIKLLAQRYADKCNIDSIKYVPFTISSVTRSVESVKRLGAVNPNSISNSAHLKGKTFDVSYTSFNKNKLQNDAFIAVLNELRLEGKCYVKYERNGCLHITVI